MSHSPGGGIASKNVTQTYAPKAEPIAKAVSPTYAGQIGQSLAYEGEAMYSGQGYEPPHPMPAAVGVGGCRTLYGQSGVQGLHGPTNPGESHPAPDPPATTRGRDILSQYGPERSRG